MPMRPMLPMQRMLERMGLLDYFNVMVTAEADMEALSQRLLAASLQLHRCAH